MTPDALAQARSLYESGQTFKEVAATLGVSWTWVRLQLKRAGVDARCDPGAAVTVLSDTLTIKDDGGGLLLVRQSVEGRKLMLCDELVLNVIDGDANGTQRTSQVNLRAGDAVALAEWIRAHVEVAT